MSLMLYCIKIVCNFPRGLRRAFRNKYAETLRVLPSAYSQVLSTLISSIRIINELINSLILIT